MEYGKLAKSEKEEWIKGLYPRVVVWELTLTCNMKCIHCGSTAGPDKQLLDELDTEKAIDLVHQLAGIGTKRIVISGGEPFLRKDWYDISLEIAKIGIIPAFISNAFILNEDIADKILQLQKIHPQTQVGLSFDGNEKIHDYLRQTKGSFKNVINAIKILNHRKIPVSIVSSISKFNIDILHEMKDILSKHDIFHWQLQKANPWGRFTKDMMLTREQYMQFLEFLVEQRKIHGDCINGADDAGYYTYIEKSLRPEGEWSGCHAGLHVLGLRSNGDVMGCLSLQEPIYIEGNIRDKKLKDFWHDPDAFSYNRSFTRDDLTGYCRECPNGIKCRAGCKNSAYSYTRSIGENVFCAFRIMLEGKDGKKGG
ncbi:radical SAM protein [Elusimicrobiota bacterium]